MSSTYIDTAKNVIYLCDCKTKDVKEAIKGLSLLKQEVIKIEIKGYFCFDTPYYHRFDENVLNRIYKDLRAWGTEAKYKNNRFYIDGIIIPDDTIERVEIYYQGLE